MLGITKTEAENQMDATVMSLCKLMVQPHLEHCGTF